MWTSVGHMTLAAQPGLRTMSRRLAGVTVRLALSLSTINASSDDDAVCDADPWNVDALYSSTAQPATTTPPENDTGLSTGSRSGNDDDEDDDDDDDDDVVHSIEAFANDAPTCCTRPRPNTPLEDSSSTR